MWKYYHWSFALLGFILCFGMNFAIKWYWAIAAVALLVALYIYIDYRQVPFQIHDQLQTYHRTDSSV